MSQNATEDATGVYERDTEDTPTDFFPSRRSPSPPSGDSRAKAGESRPNASSPTSAAEDQRGDGGSSEEFETGFDVTDRPYSPTEDPPFLERRDASPPSPESGTAHLAAGALPGRRNQHSTREDWYHQTPPQPAATSAHSYEQHRFVGQQPQIVIPEHQQDSEQATDGDDGDDLDDEDVETCWTRCCPDVEIAWVCCAPCSRRRDSHKTACRCLGRGRQSRRPRGQTLESPMHHAGAPHADQSNEKNRKNDHRGAEQLTSPKYRARAGTLTGDPHDPRPTRTIGQCLWDICCGSSERSGGEADAAAAGQAGCCPGFFNICSLEGGNVSSVFVTNTILLMVSLFFGIAAAVLGLLDATADETWGAAEIWRWCLLIAVIVGLLPVARGLNGLIFTGLENLLSPRCFLFMFYLSCLDGPLGWLIWTGSIWPVWSWLVTGDAEGTLRQRVVQLFAIAGVLRAIADLAIRIIRGRVQLTKFQEKIRSVSRRLMSVRALSVVAWRVGRRRRAQQKKQQVARAARAEKMREERQRAQEAGDTVPTTTIAMPRPSSAENLRTLPHHNDGPDRHAGSGLPDAHSVPDLDRARDHHRAHRDHGPRLGATERKEEGTSLVSAGDGMPPLGRIDDDLGSVDYSTRSAGHSRSVGTGEMVESGSVGAAMHESGDGAFPRDPDEGKSVKSNEWEETLQQLRGNGVLHGDDDGLDELHVAANLSISGSLSEQLKFEVVDMKGRIRHIRTAAGARRVASSLFNRLDPKRSGVISTHDMASLADVDEEDTEHIFECMDYVVTKEITRRDFILFVNRVFRDWRGLSRTMEGYGGVKNALHFVFDSLWWFIMILVGFVTFGVSLGDILLPLGTVMVSTSFMAAEPIRNLIFSLLFVLLYAPYDVGDRVALNGGRVVFVHRIDVLSTWFRGLDQKIFMYGNHILLNMRIENHRRSPSALIELPIRVGWRTSPEQLDQLVSGVVTWIRQRKHAWREDIIEMYIYSGEPTGTMVIAFWVMHQLPWQEGISIWGDTSRLVLAIMQLLQVLGIEYVMPPQPVALGSAGLMAPSMGLQSALRDGPDGATVDPNAGKSGGAYGSLIQGPVNVAQKAAHPAMVNGPPMPLSMIGADMFGYAQQQQQMAGGPSGVATAQQGWVPQAPMAGPEAPAFRSAAPSAMRPKPAELQPQERGQASPAVRAPHRLREEGGPLSSSSTGRYSFDGMPGRGIHHQRRDSPEWSNTFEDEGAVPAQERSLTGHAAPGDFMLRPFSDPARAPARPVPPTTTVRGIFIRNDPAKYRDGLAPSHQSWSNWAIGKPLPPTGLAMVDWVRHHAVTQCPVNTFASNLVDIRAGPAAHTWNWTRPLAERAVVDRDTRWKEAVEKEKVAREKLEADRKRQEAELRRQIREKEQRKREAERRKAEKQLTVRRRRAGSVDRLLQRERIEWHRQGGAGAGTGARNAAERHAHVDSPRTGDVDSEHHPEGIVSRASI